MPGWIAGRLREHGAGASAVAGALVSAFPTNPSARAFELLLHYRMGPGARTDQRLFYGLSYDREIFDRFGGFRDDLLAGEDTEFNSRFATVLPVAFAPDVRTAHRNPTDVGELLGDAFRRGRRRARASAQLGVRRSGLRVAIETQRGAPWGVPHAWREGSWAHRATVTTAALLVPLTAAAYVAGALAHELARGRR
jgi:hypothetical protein